ncbi:hypothetical protein BJ982_006836 [Sphaerisporangium siamense]|uniref:Uncharacterized protein n=1 Tax=Sphaerisporangium siamense TaxID=795645 RepID=A0A7W7GD70_9ACTN|nr:hypothetical protein [Sphaerisporangium siamense]
MDHPACPCVNDDRRVRAWLEEAARVMDDHRPG